MKGNKAGDLLELSLEFELNARELYKKWSELFAGTPDVAAFWQEYSVDESYHASLLEDLRERLSPQQLDTLIESDLVGDTKRLLAFLQKEPNIENLDQAYQYANMIETSEINPLFDVVMSAFEQDERTMTFLRTQLNEHVGKLANKFPKYFSRPEPRQAVKVQP